MRLYTYVNMCVYIYYKYMIFKFLYILMCVCAFLMQKSLHPLISLSGLPSFHSKPELSVSPCLSRNTKKTNEVWIYAGITLRR